MIHPADGIDGGDDRRRQGAVAAMEARRSGMRSEIRLRQRRDAGGADAHALRHPVIGIGVVADVVQLLRTQPEVVQHLAEQTAVTLVDAVLAGDVQLTVPAYPAGLQHRRYTLRRQVHVGDQDHLPPLGDQPVEEVRHRPVPEDVGPVAELRILQVPVLRSDLLVDRVEGRLPGAVGSHRPAAAPLRIHPLGGESQRTLRLLHVGEQVLRTDVRTDDEGVEDVEGDRLHSVSVDEIVQAGHRHPMGSGV